MNFYINTGNIFSRAGIILNEFKNQKSFLIITSEENILKYQKIFSSQKIKLEIIDNMSKLIDFAFNQNGFFIVNKDIFHTKLPNLYEINNHLKICFEKQKHFDLDKTLKTITDFGYKYQEFLEVNTYQKLGENLNIKLQEDFHYQISFWGEQVDEINIVKENEITKIDKLEIGKIQVINLYNQDKLNKDLLEILRGKNVILDNLDIIDDYEEISTSYGFSALEILKNPHKEQINLDTTDLMIDGMENLVKLLKETNLKVEIYSKNITSIKNFIEYNNLNIGNVFKTDLSFLKSYKNPKKIVICDDNLSKIFIKKRIKNSLSENIDLLLQIKPGDLVVHIDHGIGIFKEICQKTLGEITKQYIEIEYKNNDKLFVPITEIKRISKYIGKENPTLTGLSTKEWTKKLQKAGEDVEILANELLEIYAKRKIKKGFAFDISNKEIINFQKDFEYEYTLDQINAIDEIFKDLSLPKPMDRILVGDVGFGKTEVAFNAVFCAILNKKQAAIISPLVVLAYEHYSKALERFRNFGINIEVLTRFETDSQAKVILDKLKNGKIDLIIGTHRLLSENVIYKDLGLLVIDEEHKFGVGQKEEIQKFKNNIDVLSMSATPIPRSLNMALNGIKEVSILSKAPDIRKGVETYVSKFDENLIKQIGQREFDRGGQLFFIHNRVSTIDNMSKILSEIFPDKKIIITHGQLNGNELEDRIIAFKRKEYDILLSSTVIENGIDFPNVNSIIINDAYKFGISQLHQLRGRVGRSDKHGYCYLLFKKDKIGEDGIKRLQTMVEYSHLGAGFELAIKDLEIRGGGDILGVRQSGTASDIGINVFLKMLEEKIEELKLKSVDFKDEKITKKIETTIDLNVGAYLDDAFFDSELDKINFYREIESISDLEDLENLVGDFIEINGSLNKENQNLFNLLKLKITSSKFKITSIKRAGVSFEINFEKDISTQDLKDFLDLDKNAVFIVNDLTKLKTPARNFKNDEEFLNYLLEIFKPKKITIKDGRKIVKLTKN